MIKIPDKYYVGVRAKAAKDKEIPLGFATPNTGDAAFQKRKKTVDAWVGGGKGARHETFDNVLVEGFRISQSVRRYGWNGGNVVWRIEDPRGFELEITSSNFASIVDCTTLDKGVIAGKCVWGRDGSTNILLPEASEPYQEAVKFTDLSKKAVSVKELEVGQYVRLKDDKIAVYAGAYHGFGINLELEWKYDYSHTYGGNYRNQRYQHELVAKKLAKRHVYLVEKAAEEYIKTGVINTKLPHPEHPTHPDITIPGLISYSDVKQVAEIIDRKIEIDVDALKAAILNHDGSKWSSVVFSHKPSAILPKALKKVEFKVVEGETPGSLRLYEDPKGVLYHITEQSFHAKQTSQYSGPPEENRELYYYAYPISLPLLVLDQTQIHTSFKVDKISKDHFNAWTPKTLIAVIDGELEVPVRSYHYNHEVGKPMTETSITRHPLYKGK